MIISQSYLASQASAMVKKYNKKYMIIHVSYFRKTLNNIGHNANKKEEKNNAFS
jgi:hypothetical protein